MAIAMAHSDFGWLSFNMQSFPKKLLSGEDPESQVGMSESEEEGV